MITLTSPSGVKDTRRQVPALLVLSPSTLEERNSKVLYNQAQNISRDESLEKEESHLMKTFIGSGYPRAFTGSAVARLTPSNEDDKKPPVAFPIRSGR